MSEHKDKTPEDLPDEDYKVAPTSSDTKVVDKIATSKEGGQATGENYELLRVERGKEKKEGMIKEEMKEGVE